MPTDDENRWTRISELFSAALALPKDARNAFLQRECGSDTDLLTEIRSLLAADDDGSVDLDQIVGGLAAQVPKSTEPSLLEQRIGNYQLVELLGTGGMGNVYLGRRIDEQFEHEVAIKVLLTGKSNSLFVERFRAERQVLASLDHPNIAKLLDGGESDVGLQYLVMEYVRGEPIDSYCDNQRLVRSLEILRSLRDKWHPDIEWVLRLRATAYSNMGDQEMAARLTAEADLLLQGREKVSAEEAKKSQAAEF